MQLPTDRPESAPATAAAKRVMFGFGAREIGVGAVALAVLIATGTWWHRTSQREEAALKTARAELALHEDAALYYEQRIASLKSAAVQMRLWAEAQATDAVRTWARERARRFESLLADMARDTELRAFIGARKEIEQLLAHGEIEAARTRLRDLPAITFPGPSEFSRRREALYEAPLAAFSRQNPEFYRAFRQHEAEAAKRDEEALRAELRGASTAEVTPQLMLKLDLLAAVAAPDDPLVADWSALASALDYFENPDGATLAAWRRAQSAVRRQDWGAAANEMQAIVKSKVRTRQPFRAAFGRALLRSRPDAAGDAYPYLAEAAGAGDKQARAWVAQEDLKNGRFAQAERWVEAALADGDPAVVPMLLELYQQGDGSREEAARRAGVLERVTDRPDTPPEALLLLGRLYERVDPAGSKRAKAFECYRRAAAKGLAAAETAVARCALRGVGVPANLDLARDAACRAWQGGQREEIAPVMLELLRETPDRSAGAIQRVVQNEDLAGGGGYTETRSVDGPGVAQVKAELARYLDQIGQFALAARLYAGSRDPEAVRRHAQLTVARSCPTCGGKGKVQESAPCPTCAGKGTQLCGFCGGTGTILAPGTPPCGSCGGAGTMIQDRRVVACSSCGGSGKGKGSVIKQDCRQCEGGQIRCTSCISGTIQVTKDCPECRGKGTWSLVEKGQ